MPIMSNSRRRSRGNVEGGSGGVPLEGWDFIQEKILSHDEDMIADYADDIDTLLVFAGLFSAVLTAFLVVSIILLQPDNSQLSVQLLSLIALQNGAPTSVQSFLNETAELLPTSTTFRAPRTVVTINTLWFASLVLSLTAALFGILAKQWCREYLRWHSIIASARENVLIRQVRYDAWERWRVPSYIASIPAFLEIAVILFLVGLLNFVPTFSERSLTVVISVIIGIGLAGVVVLTCLPVFYRLCPFQTPTGWAVVRTAVLLRSACRHLALRVVIIIECAAGKEQFWFLSFWGRLRVRLMQRETRLQDWRTLALSALWQQARHTSVVTRKCTDEACKAVGMRQIPHACTSNDAIQTRMLVRTLSWIRRGSNDEATLTAIIKCLSSIHDTEAITYIHTCPPFLSSIYALCPTDLSVVCRVVMSLSDTMPEGLYHDTDPESIVGYYELCGPFIISLYEPAQDQDYQAAYDGWASDPPYFDVCHALLRIDLLALVDAWLSVQSEYLTCSAVAKEIIFLLHSLRILPSHNAAGAALHFGLPFIQRWVDTLEEVYRKLAPYKDAYVDGLVVTCLELCRLCGPVNLNHEGHEHHDIVDIGASRDLVQIFWQSFEQRECNLLSTWATLAVDIYHHNNHYEDANQRHVFVALVSRVFKTMRLRIKADVCIINGRVKETITPIVDLLDCMIGALRWSLVHSHPDCGAYTSLSWIKDIMRCYEAAKTSRRLSGSVLREVLLTDHSTLRPTFLLMLRLSGTCLDRGLLTGLETAEDFTRLLHLLRLTREDLPQLPADLIDSLRLQETGVRQEAGQQVQMLPDPESVGADVFELPGEVVPQWSPTPLHITSGIDVVPPQANFDSVIPGGSDGGAGSKNRDED